MQDIQHWSTDNFFGRTACNLRAWCSNSLSSFKIDEGLGFPRQRKKAASCLRGANSILTSDIYSRQSTCCTVGKQWNSYIVTVYPNLISHHFFVSIFHLLFLTFLSDVNPLTVSNTA